MAAAVGSIASAASASGTTSAATTASNAVTANTDILPNGDTSLHPLPRIGIFGTGWGTRVQVPAFRSAGFLIVALWGRTQAKAERIASELDIPFASSNADDLLMRSEIDMVCIVTPPHLHAELAIKAITAGKHVISDKPTALNVTEAMKMVEASRYFPRLLSLIDHQMRFLPAFCKMKDLLAQGYCGKIMMMDAKVMMGTLIRGEYNWWCDEVLGGGALGALGSHIVDALVYLTGLRAHSVNGIVKTFVQETDRIHGFRYITSDDYCTFTMKVATDVLATVTLNTHTPGKFVQEIMVIGSDGRMILKGSDLYGFRSGMSKEQLIYTENTMTSPYVRGTVLMANALADAFSTGDFSLLSCAASFEDGLYTQSVLDSVRKSSKHERWVNIEPPSIENVTMLPNS